MHSCEANTTVISICGEPSKRPDASGVASPAIPLASQSSAAQAEDGLSRLFAGLMKVTTLDVRRFLKQRIKLTSNLVSASAITDTFASFTSSCSQNLGAPTYHTKYDNYDPNNNNDLWTSTATSLTPSTRSYAATARYCSSCSG